MPLEDLTMPSSRSVLTCKPALPGGRFLPAPASLLRLTRDSNGSRRADLSPSGEPCASAEGVAVSTGFRAADLALGLAVFDGCCEGLAAGGATFAPPAGLACASKLEHPATSKIPTRSVFTERIVRPFRLHLSSWLGLRTRGCGGGACISRLGEERRCGKCSGNRSARS